MSNLDKPDHTAVAMDMALVMALAMAKNYL